MRSQTVWKWASTCPKSAAGEEFQIAKCQERSELQLFSEVIIVSAQIGK